MDTRYTTADVLKIAPVTARRLQWLDEQGVVSPDIIEHQRRYTALQVVEVLLIAELRRKRIPLQKLRTLQADDWYLVTDLHSIVFCDRDAAIRMGVKSAHAIVVVSVGEQFRKIGEFNLKQKRKASAA